MFHRLIKVANRYRLSPTATVTLGSVKFNQNHESGVEKRKVLRQIIHKNYIDVGDIKNDISLLLLDKPVNFSENIQPLCLPDGVEVGLEDLDDAFCTFSGWGYTQEDHSKIWIFFTKYSETYRTLDNFI